MEPIELLLAPATPLDEALQAMIEQGILIWQGASKPSAKTAYLYCGPDGAALCIPPFKPMSAELSRSHWQSRRQEGKQGIVRAVKPKPGRIIWDVTAGWGRDAAIMASFGASVCMFEKHPIIAYLLQDALYRANQAGDALPLSLEHADALDVLRSFPNGHFTRPDVIYLDPMHPERQKSALVKKDLQLLQALLAPSNDTSELIHAASAVAKERVVLKWPAHQTVPVPCTAKVPGKSVHYYLYEP